MRAHDKAHRGEGCARFAEGRRDSLLIPRARRIIDVRESGVYLFGTSTAKMVEPIFDYQFRLILIGDSTVGKSSLLKYFTDGKFAEVHTQLHHPRERDALRE